MKYDITGSVCLCANTLDMDSSGSKHSQGDELNLEELIKCVSLGKTAVDPVRDFILIACWPILLSILSMPTGMMS